MLAVAAAPAALALTLSTVARADGSSTPAKACIDANAKAQELRREGKLSAARAELNRCAERACPSMVRDDCARRLDELDHIQPTVVFSAKDGDGADLSAVTVSVDGQRVADRLDGSALAVDPGEHAFTFETRGQAPVTRQLVIREGEKGRTEAITIGTPTARPPSPKPAVTASLDLGSTPPPSDVNTGEAQRISGFVIGGVGLAGLAAGGVFGLLAMSAWNNAKSECGAMCTQQNHDDAVKNHSKTIAFGNTSTGAFIGGGVFVALGTVLVLTAPHGPGGTAWSVSPAVGPGVADLTLRGRF